MIKWLREIKKEDFHLAGGKGANLALMLAYDLAVPDGFVILTSAYDEYVEANYLKESIDGILASDAPIFEQSKAIQALFAVEKLSQNFLNSVRGAFAEVATSGEGRVAVRSSSTVEDLPGMSFAGQYSTYLNVAEDQLTERVIECWRSLWNERAMEYRLKNQVTVDFSHAVVVQKMVKAAVSGVAFTANPMNGIRHQLVINASFGLGEAIVSGELNPDQYTVDRNTGVVIDRTINKKSRKVVARGTGIDWVALGDQEANTSSLNEEQIGRLAEAADQIETLFGRPQDLEFAFDNQNILYILQSRDITTLFPIDKLEQDGKLRAYMSAGTVLFGMKEPFTNLGYDLMSHMFPTIINVMTNRQKKPLTNHFVRHAGNRIFVDMTVLLSSGFVTKQFAKAFSGNDLPLEGVITSLMKDYGKQFKHQGIRFRFPLGFIGYGVKMAGTVRMVSKIPHEDRYAAMRAEGNQWYERALKRYEQAVTLEERLNFAVENLVEAFKLSQLQASYCMDANNYIKIEKVLAKYFGTQYKVETLAQSLPGCFTQTMTIRLNEYAKICVERDVNPYAADPEFQKILEIYGHRANLELDFGTKRWREDPSFLLGLVETYMEDGMYKRNLADHKKKRREAELMIEEVADSLIEKIGKRKAEKFRMLMIHYRYGAAMREYPKSDIVRFLELSRNAVLSIGDELVAAGQLDEPEDIFFLYKKQILVGRELKDLVESNKAVYNKEMRRTTIPRMLINNGHTVYTATTIAPHAKTLQGMPLSAGTYEGIVRVVFDPRTTELQEGEILVTESTNPAWTPLFAIAGALIMEYGGPMSHGGIVAREYGLPAVVGISSATEVLKDGQRVRVNGENGSVQLIE
jgi:pyruvate,water dikinase